MCYINNEICALWIFQKNLEYSGTGKNQFGRVRERKQTQTRGNCQLAFKRMFCRQMERIPERERRAGRPKKMPWRYRKGNFKTAKRTWLGFQTKGAFGWTFKKQNGLRSPKTQGVTGEQIARGEHFMIITKRLCNHSQPIPRTVQCDFDESHSSVGNRITYQRDSGVITMMITPRSQRIVTVVST